MAVFVCRCVSVSVSMTVWQGKYDTMVLVSVWQCKYGTMASVSVWHSKYGTMVLVSAMTEDNDFGIRYGTVSIALWRWYHQSTMALLVMHCTVAL